MKKIIAVFLTCIFAVISFSACSDGNKSQDNTAAASANSEISSSESNSSKKSKILVVYFSATGSTKKVAEYIKDETGADTFEIEPSTPYSNDDLNYNDENSRVCKEHNDEDRKVELKSTAVPKWEDYDTVYIGYPIWWGTAAWPTDAFVSANDFTGKTVIPFCTSASSPLGNSATELAAKANGGNWLTGKRFSSGAERDEVSDWVKSIG